MREATSSWSSSRPSRAETRPFSTSRRNHSSWSTDVVRRSGATDHIGNVEAFEAATWLVHQGDYDVMFGPNVSPESIGPVHVALKNRKHRIIEGDYDVFGDGTVVLKSTPGHTPGHQSLYVKLPRTGGVVLSGDLYHYPEERTLNRMPEREKLTPTPASRAALEIFMKQVGAQLWIGHDITTYSKQKHAPEYYD